MTHLQQTIVSTKTAGRQPGSGSCCLRSSPCATHAKYVELSGHFVCFFLSNFTYLHFDAGGLRNLHVIGASPCSSS